MRKRNILVIVEHLMWGIIILLPIIFWLLSPLGFSIGGGSETNPSLPEFGSIMSSLGVNVNGNLIYTALSDLFGANGILPMFINNTTSTRAMLWYFTYFINVEVIHLFIDILLFIPRLAHKWMSKFTNEEVIDNG